MTKREAKIIALRYVVSCVASDEADGHTLLLGHRGDKYPEKDGDKIQTEVSEICYAIGDRLRKLEGERVERII